MDKIKPANKILISQSKITNAGRGVFASNEIGEGEIIEICPVIEIPSQDAESINNSMVVTYIYYLGKDKNRMSLALGYGSIYNHSYNPNAKYLDKKNENQIHFIAIKNIKKGDEITVNYSQGNKKIQSPLWFEAK